MDPDLIKSIAALNAHKKDLEERLYLTAASSIRLFTDATGLSVRNITIEFAETTTNADSLRTFVVTACHVDVEL